LNKQYKKADTYYNSRLALNIVNYLKERVKMRKEESSVLIKGKEIISQSLKTRAFEAFKLAISEKRRKETQEADAILWHQQRLKAAFWKLASESVLETREDNKIEAESNRLKKVEVFNAWRQVITRSKSLRLRYEQLSIKRARVNLELFFSKWKTDTIAR